jgi:Arc/MetJ-type ribon-helix-helix transcriptional regulator
MPAQLDIKVRQTITLTDDLAAWIDAKVRKISRQTGEPANVSKYIRDLIREDKERDKQDRAA